MTKTTTQRMIARMTAAGIAKDRAYGAIRVAHFLARPDRYVNGLLDRHRLLDDIADRADLGFQLPKDTGFRRYAGDELEGTQAMLGAAAEILEHNLHKSRDAKKKGFLENLVTDVDLVEHPAIMDYVLQPTVVMAAARYLGTMPRLRGVALNYTYVNDTKQVSQLWHRDGIDTVQVKFIVNLMDVEAENGPFTFLSADDSDELARRVDWRNGRVQDDDVLGALAEDSIQNAAGAAGSGICIDTSRCFHFGARARGKPRYVMIFNFTGSYKLVEEVELPALYQAYKGDPLRRSLLAFHDG